MSLAIVLLTPLALLLPAAGALEPVRGAGELAALRTDGLTNHLALPADDMVEGVESADTTIFQLISGSFQPQLENQVRIEQRITIRITPRPLTLQPQMLADMPARPLPRRLIERATGSCLPIAGIAGVEASQDNRLILYMRDRRVLSAGLERACSARDYYSGFYVQRNSDGQICVQRDTLLSRSGANCKLTRLRQLVQAGD